MPSRKKIVYLFKHKSLMRDKVEEELAFLRYSMEALERILVLYQDFLIEAPHLSQDEIEEESAHLQEELSTYNIDFLAHEAVRSIEQISSYTSHLCEIYRLTLSRLLKKKQFGERLLHVRKTR
ncbi:hypothetical protein STHERM_c12590 [Spirochaeta thermophila DSM 6192]|uniref:Uncharacterized protein n=4 Tax=Winmispira thermophila TaxID=154 RepID=G0GC87_WINT7|nr:hypothetical protein STHERM_c12590 [Spirochaeta thermophila DSM 6192]AEJ61172.1 hypothetical protein Spith_0898 [Spirochaeta thermophila DSM 6578]